MTTGNSTQATPADGENTTEDSEKSSSISLPLSIPAFLKALENARNEGKASGREIERKAQQAQNNIALHKINEDIRLLQKELGKLTIAVSRSAPITGTQSQGEPKPEPDLLDNTFGVNALNTVGTVIEPAPHGDPAPEHYEYAVKKSRESIPTNVLDDHRLKLLVAGMIVSEYVNVQRENHKYDNLSPDDLKSKSNADGMTALRMIEEPKLFKDSDLANAAELFEAFVLDGTKEVLN